MVTIDRNWMHFARSEFVVYYVFLPICYANAEFIMAGCIDVLFSPVTSIFVFYVCLENNFVLENLCFGLCACWFVGPLSFWSIFVLAARVMHP